MSNYTKSTNFATKDNLPTGDPLKIVKGTEIDTEFNNIATAISTKTDNASAAITGGSITGITDLAIADGGTGASTATAAINNLLPSQTSNANKYLQTDGTNVSWDAISINTGDITGTLPVANGGTGVTSSTGTGSVVLSNSPTLVTPSLGAATASTLDVSGNVTLSGGTANSIPYLNGSKVVTTGTELYFNGTNLGVGASASYRVDLGSATSDDAAVGIRIGRGGSNTTWSLIDNVGGSGNYRQYSSGTPTLRWLTSTDGSSWSEQMRLNATGLGVGNNNPAAKLDVTGSALVSGSVTATSFAGALNGTVGATTPTTGAFTTIAASSSVTLSGGTANGVTYLNGSKVLTSGSALTFDGTTLTNNNSGQGFLQTNTSASTYASFKGNTGGTTIWTGIGTDTGISWLGSVSNHDVVFRQNNTEGMRLTSTGLGIGTSSPSYKLDVVAANNAKAFQISGATTGYSYATINNTTTKVVLGVTDSTGTLFSTKLSSTYHIGLGTDNGYGLAFATNDVERVFIDNAGNLGLGVTPSASWASIFRVQQIGNYGAYIAGRTDSQNQIWLGTNSYYNGTNWIYSNSTAASYYVQTNAQHQWFNAPSGTAGNAISFTQAMTLDASGNLGVGTTSPSFPLDVVGNSGSNAINIRGRSADNIGTFRFTSNNGATSYATLQAASTRLEIATVSTLPIIFSPNQTEAARIDSSGNFCYGVNSFSAASNGFLVSANGASTYTAHANGTSSGATYSYFYYNNSAIGSITQSGTTAVLYNVTSDQRLKENIQDADSASSLIDSLQVRKFDWKADGSHQRYGFVAQELVTVAPEAVHQPADTEEMMAVDYSKLVPMLVKEIQSLRQRLAAANL